VVVFLDANQNESRFYRPQIHDRKFKSDTGFNIDGTIDGSLKTFVENTGSLHNILNTKYGDENVPPTRCPGSSVIDYVYASEGLPEHVIYIAMLNFDAVFDSDHRTFFLDIDFESVFGTELDNMAALQFRQLQLDDPRIAEGYRKIIHKLFTNHYIYKRMQNIAARGKKEDWTMEDDNLYEAIDMDIPRSMLSAAKKCNLRKMHTRPWSPDIGLETHVIRYWDVRIKYKGDRNPMSGVLSYYLSLSDVEADARDKPLPVEEYVKQINQARQKLKDVVANTKEHRTQFEVELATAIVEHKHPYFCDGNECDPVDKDNLVAKVLKTRENWKTAKRSWKKLGRQIRGIIKPETLKRSRLTKIEVPDGDEWKKVEGKETMEKHLMGRNIEQFSHAGKTPFGYSDLGAELGHTGDSQMANDILKGTLQHECLSNEAIREIVNQLREHPMVQQIWKPVATPEDFTSCFKWVPEKAASSYSGRSVPHYKA
jgi:hypothetical protein